MLGNKTDTLTIDSLFGQIRTHWQNNINRGQSSRGRMTGRTFNTEMECGECDDEYATDDGNVNAITGGGGNRYHKMGQMNGRGGRGNGRNPHADKQCHRCGRMGHLQATCKTQPCILCNDLKHRSSECPRLPECRQAIGTANAGSTIPGVATKRGFTNPGNANARAKKPKGKVYSVMNEDGEVHEYTSWEDMMAECNAVSQVQVATES